MLARGEAPGFRGPKFFIFPTCPRRCTAAHWISSPVWGNPLPWNPSPLRGCGNGGRSPGPRALPWARILRPYGAVETGGGPETQGVALGSHPSPLRGDALPRNPSALRGESPPWEPLALRGDAPPRNVWPLWGYTPPSIGFPRPFGMMRCPEGAWDVSPGRSPG